jgi:hypothetical protein
MVGLAMSALVLLSVTPATQARKAPIVGPVPAGLGVNIHFTDPKPGEMEMLAASGCTWVRMDFDWNRIEVEKGVYDFKPYEVLIGALEKHNIRALFILDYVHRLYDNAQSPHSEEAQDAMARWAAAAAVHFRGKGILWEMYNEPNIFPFWRPRPNVHDYTRLALKVGKAIRAAAPGELYGGPATSGMDFPFLEECFKAGLLEYWDYVTVHPYRQQDPETVAKDYARLRAMIDRYAPRGKRIPIVSGEWGYSAVWAGMDAERQGKLLPRQWLTNLANDIPLSIWYDWHDDGPDPKEPEHHFGTVEHPYLADQRPVYKPKPAYRAMSTLTATLRGLTHNKRLWVGEEQDHVHLFAAEGKEVLVAWTTSREPREVTIPASPGAFSVKSHLGAALPDAVADREGLRLRLTDAPVYLTPKAENRLLRLAASWERAPLDLLARKGTAQLRLSLRNPFAQPITVQVASRTIRVAPGRRTTLNWPPFATGRIEETKPVTATITFPGEGALSQQVGVRVMDPLRVTVLPPSSRGLDVRVESPNGAPFSGEVVLAGLIGAETAERSRPVSLSAKVPSTETSFVLRNASQEAILVKVELREAGGATVLTEGPLVFRSVDDFARQPTDGPLLGYNPFLDGDAKVGGEFKVFRALPPEGPPAPGMAALRVDYRFEAGWKFFNLGMTDMGRRRIEGRPKAYGLWIYGDGSGNIFRVRFVDATGQTHQPDGPPLDWKGWRYVSLPMDGTRAGHWGGRNDGQVYYPIHWDAPFLLDSRTTPVRGTIFIAGPTLIYDGAP